MARSHRRQPLRASGLRRQRCPEAWRGQNEDRTGLRLPVKAGLPEIVSKRYCVLAQARTVREMDGPVSPKPRDNMGPQRGLGPGPRGSWATVTGKRQCRVVPADHPSLRPRECPRKDTRHRHRSRAAPLQENDVRVDADRAAFIEAHRDGRAARRMAARAVRPSPRQSRRASRSNATTCPRLQTARCSAR